MLNHLELPALYNHLKNHHQKLTKTPKMYNKYTYTAHMRFFVSSTFKCNAKDFTSKSTNRTNRHRGFF